MEVQKIKFIELRAGGMSLAKISKEIGISKPTLILWQHQHQDEIENAKALEIEAIKEDFTISRRESLTKLIELEAKAFNELLTRDLKNIPTDKLMKMLFELNEKTSNLKVKIKKDPFEYLGINYTEISL